MSRYTQRFDREGFEIRNKVIFKLACCDCGLVHRVAIAAPILRKGVKIGIAVERDIRATAAKRRAVKKTKMAEK
jgi:hypothetical protein